MLVFNKSEHCSICHHEYTSNHIEAITGVKIYVCENCLEAAKYNFIWICISCGRVYIRPKHLVIESIADPELKKAYTQFEDIQIIQGIDVCIECDHEGILNYMDNTKLKAEC